MSVLRVLFGCLYVTLKYHQQDHETKRMWNMDSDRPRFNAGAINQQQDLNQVSEHSVSQTWSYTSESPGLWPKHLCFAKALYLMLMHSQVWKPLTWILYTPVPSSTRHGSMPAPQVSTKAGEGQETSVSLSCTQYILDFPFELIFLRWFHSEAFSLLSGSKLFIIITMHLLFLYHTRQLQEFCC